MPGLSQMEFNAIREIASGHLTTATKLNEYSQHCTDPTIKQMFHTAAQEAKKSAVKLTDML